MKLSDMSFDAMMNVVSTIAVEVEPLLEDEKIVGLTEDFKRLEDETNAEYGRRMSKKTAVVLALLSGKYRSVLYRILGAFFNCSEDEVREKSIAEIAAQIKDSLDDEVLHGFFPQLRLLVQNE